ncbi:unnamed protein product [Ceratitis capitata]|uniref:(Mediterranean fruit fly) hypothetical protein n=1 Tax=Ceratitis capitata TaxID=7213 RepID=A0A811U3T2_CERCA|nr:unnamed protein product [Ceratitis capitata]
MHIASPGSAAAASTIAPVVPHSIQRHALLHLIIFFIHIFLIRFLVDFGVWRCAYLLLPFSLRLTFFFLVVFAVCLSPHPTFLVTCAVDMVSLQLGKFEPSPLLVLLARESQCSENRICRH